jgi:large subunit ribosomal protein L24
MVKKPSPKSPRKQRRQVKQNPTHARKSLLNCRLDEFLQEEYGLRSLHVKKGDLVKIMRGQFRDTEGKVIRVDHKNIRVHLDSATVTKSDGKEAKLELNDERKKLIESKLMKSGESEE